MRSPEQAPQPDFSARLHDLRSAALRTLPAGARTVLHGGAAGPWYFDWFDDNYPGAVERHIAVEAFLPRPAGLPDNVEWLQRTLGDIGPVPSDSIDMVFAGQVIEHLWADDVAGFLLESHRTLRQGGHLVLDSPNRRVTEAIGWQHPQHTAELSVDEATRLLTLAGFEVLDVRGILLGYTRERHAFIGLEEEPPSWEERAQLAEDRPEDSFVWWIVARRTNVEPNAGALIAGAHELADAFRVRRFRKLSTPLTPQRSHDRPPYVLAPVGYNGLLLHGPNAPLDRGDWTALFSLRLLKATIDPSTQVAWLDVASDGGNVVHARRSIAVGELDRSGAWTAVALDLSLPAMTMGVELRAFTTGELAIGAQLTIDIRRPEDQSVTIGGRSPFRGPVGIPEPRTVELLDVIRRRVVARAKSEIERRRR